MLYKENKKSGRNLKKSKTRRIPFFNEKDFRVFAAVNGVKG